MNNFNESLKNLKEALNKFLLENKDNDEDKANSAKDLVANLLDENAIKMDDEEYNDTYGSEDYYDSSC